MVAVAARKSSRVATLRANSGGRQWGGCGRRGDRGHRGNVTSRWRWGGDNTAAKVGEFAP